MKWTSCPSATLNSPSPVFRGFCTLSLLYVELIDPSEKFGKLFQHWNSPGKSVRRTLGTGFTRSDGTGTRWMGDCVRYGWFVEIRKYKWVSNESYTVSRIYSCINIYCFKQRLLSKTANRLQKMFGLPPRLLLFIQTLKLLTVSKIMCMNDWGFCTFTWHPYYWY